MKAPRLRYRNFVPPGGHFHIARVEFRPGMAPSLHTHDFAEVFWIERGRGVHLINDRRLPLRAGDVVCVRPSDRHGFLATAVRFTLVNVAFAARAMTDLRRRYYPKDDGHPWRDDELPETRALDAGAAGRLSEWADGLAAAPQTRLELDRFLLNLLHALASGAGGNVSPVDAASPEWLSRALAAFRDPAHLPDGAAALARLADRCPEHLNRVVRRRYGKTATDLVNDLRLEHAARQLQMTGRPILDVAIECGLSNLGYFYRLFNARFGQTPRQFRLQKHGVVK